MLKYILLVILFVSLPAQSGLAQKHLLSASQTMPIEIKFDLPIDKHSLSKKTLVVKNANNKKLKGITKIKNDNILVFYNDAPLEAGVYKVRVKHISLLDYNKNTMYQKSARKMCSLFYDDLNECRMYRYASRVKTKKIKYSFEVEDDQAKLVSLTLSKENLQINLDESSDINVTATYDDNTSADITKEVQWSMSDSSADACDFDVEQMLKGP